MTLEQRVAALERSNKRWQFAAIGLLVVSIGNAKVSDIFRGTDRADLQAQETAKKADPLNADKIKAREIEVTTIRAHRIDIVEPGKKPATVLFPGKVLAFNEGGGQADLTADRLMLAASSKGATTVLKPTGQTYYTASGGAAINIDVKKNSGSILLRNCTTVFEKGPERDAAEKKLLGGNLSDAETKTLTDKIDGTRMIQLSEVLGGGGVVNVYNGRGKTVTSMMSTKSNTGLVFAGDVNGENGKFLIP